MRPISKSSGIWIPHMGIVGASFGAFLTIMTMDPVPELAVAAAINFSIGIPISVALLFIPEINGLEGLIKKLLLLLNIALVYIGFVACMLGLHKCFQLVSKQAGDNFSGVSLSVLAVLYLWATYDYLVKPILEKDNNQS